MNVSAPEKSGFGRPIDFLVLGAAWLLVGSFFQVPRAAPASAAAWVLLTSVISIFALGAIGYFERHLPKSKVSGVLNLLLVLPSSALISKGLLAWTAFAPPFDAVTALEASLGVALLFESSQWLLLKTSRALEKRWELETYLLPQEEEALAAQVEASGASGWIKIRSRGLSGADGAAASPHATVVISRGAARDLKNCPELLSAHLRGQRIVDISQLLKELRGRVRIRHADAWTFLLGSTYQSPGIRLYFYLKTFLEQVLAVALLVLISPLLAALSLAVLVTSGRPILYRQQRLGYRGRQFPLFKFRTMPVTAEGGGPQWAKENDARITPIGRWLRKTHLDELPQLMNVARRELSFVGPRPERPEFYKILNEQIPLFPLRLQVRPGVTGWAQTKQKYAGNVEECKTKLEYDLYYVQNMSPLFDLKVMVDTIGLLLRGDGGR